MKISHKRGDRCSASKMNPKSERDEKGSQEGEIERRWRERGI
jgi:hypothetical protein